MENRRKDRWDSFDWSLSSSIEDLDFELKGHLPLPWGDFFLNPRRLRGSDFLMRWNQGVWSENRIHEAINRTPGFCSLPYGPSGTAPDDIREYELYFERLERAGLAQLKRPDILIFRKSDEDAMNELVKTLGGPGELPFIPEEDAAIRLLLSKAVIAVECENSLWRARQMPAYGRELKPMRRLGGKPGLAKNAVLPTVIIKEEDRERLLIWQSQNDVAIHVWHLFFDLAFGISLDGAVNLVNEGLIEPTRQVFQAPGGATTSKDIYKVYYHYAYRIGDVVEEPTLTADSITDNNGHILPFVRFEGGRLAINGATVELLEAVARERDAG